MNGLGPEATTGEAEAYARGFADALAWQPIETAPRDGTPVLVWVPGSGIVWEKACAVAADWVDGRWRVANVDGWEWDGPLDYPRQPTHWMPMPPPPPKTARACGFAADLQNGGAV